MQTVLVTVTVMNVQVQGSFQTFFRQRTNKNGPHYAWLVIKKCI